MLGICCHYVNEVTKKNGTKELVNEFDERVLQLGRYRSGKYTTDQITGTYIHNIKRLIEMLPKIRKISRHFRMSSVLLPLADQVDRKLWDNDEVRKQLKIAGDYVKSHEMRITSHPGQFCVLSSDSPATVKKTVYELEIHSWIFDAMGLDRSPYYAINIHGGKSDRHENLVKQINLLPDGVKKRLTLENDETCYNVPDLLRVYQDTGVPICFDSHHFVFNTGHLEMDEAFEASCATWSDGINPLQHISNTEPELANGNFVDRRKHSAYIHYVPECQLRLLQQNKIDVEVEAKHKQLAVIDMSRKFNISL